MISRPLHPDDSPASTGTSSTGTSSTGIPSVGAILLTGGRASRVDGAAKHLFEVGGRTLLAHAVDAAASAGAHRIVIVGPTPETTRDLLDEHPSDPTVEWMREDPPFGGPAAGVVAALDEWTARTADRAPEWMLVLACDLPGVGPAVRRLMRDILLHPSDIDGVCLADRSSRPQWLTGVYRRSALSRAAAALPGGGRDASARALLADLAIAVITAPPEETADIDTWQDLDDARVRAHAPDRPENATACPRQHFISKEQP